MLLKRRVGFSQIIIVCNTLMIFGSLFTELVAAKDSLPLFLGIPTKFLWVILGPRGRIFMGAGYISVGMLLAECDEKTKEKKYALLILGAIVTTLTSGFAKSLAFVFRSTSLFSVVKNMNFGHNKLSMICRRCSTVMYFLLWIWTLYYICVYGEKKYGMDSFIVTTCISFILGVLFSGYKDKWLKKHLREE